MGRVGTRWAAEGTKVSSVRDVVAFREGAEVALFQMEECSIRDSGGIPGLSSDHRLQTSRSSMEPAKTSRCPLVTGFQITVSHAPHLGLAL